MYDAETANRLKPWPSALSICVRLGWTIAGLVLAGLLISSGSAMSGGQGAPLIILGMLLGWAMVVAVAMNSYFQIRWMLKRSLPNQVRTRGPIGVLRAIGTTVCVLILLGFVGAPLAFGIGCLIVLSQS